MALADTTRILVLELADTDSEDNLQMALATWERDNPDRPIRRRQVFSAIVGDAAKLQAH
jgi:hypothetical protein